MCESLTFLLDNIYIWFGTKLYRQIVDIPMGTYCAHLFAHLFLFCYVRDFMLSLSADKQAEIFKASIQRLDIRMTYWTIDNTYFDGMVNQIYPSELQLNKTNSPDTVVSFLDLHLTISDGFVYSKIYDKCDDFWFRYY